MNELLIVNPSDRDGAVLYEENPSRRKGRRHGRRRASAKQLAWRRKFARLYGGKGRKRRGINPRRRRRNPASIVYKGTKKRVSAAAWKRSPYRRNPRGRRRYRSNPIAVRASMRGITDLLIESAQGAVGATLVDAAMGQLVVRGIIPSTLLTPTTYPLVKGGVAIALGIVANMAPLPAVAKRFMAHGVKGSLICTLRDTIQPYVSAYVPLGQVHRYMNYTPGTPRSGYMGWRSSAKAMVPGPQRPVMGEYLGASMSTRERQAYYPAYGQLGTYMNY